MTTSLSVEKSNTRSLWTRLTEPHPSIVDVGERRRARLIASLLFSMALAGIGGWMTTALTSQSFNVTSAVVTAISVSLTLMAYALSRTPRYQQAALIATGLVIAAIFASAATSSNTTTSVTNVFHYFALAGFFGALTLTFRKMLAVMVVSIGVFLFFPLLFPARLTPADNTNIVTTLIFLVMMYGVITIFVRYRDSLEQDRQAQLTIALQKAETANTALAQSQTLLRSVIDNLPQSVVWKDRQSRYLGMNEQFVKDSGMESQDQMIGKDDHAMPWKDRAALYIGDDQAVMESDTPRLNYEEPLTRADGTEIWLRTSKVPMHDANDSVSGIVIIVEDITQQRQQEEERDNLIQELQTANIMAAESVRLKSEFMSTMSHELRTPLNAIRGFTGIMLEGMGGVVDEEARHMLERIDSNGGRLLGLINDLLDIAKIEAGRMELVSEAISPRALAERWRSLTGVLAEQKGLKLDIMVAADLPDTLYGDSERITQIVTNLLSNAIKFTREGRVSLAMKRQPEHWILEVSDTGVGIPPHALNYIFDEFRQVDGSTKRAYGGSGLGLAIVRNLCQMMGGNVKVSSELGKGSVFTVTLPLVADRQSETQILEIA
jgi:PAS domain S-box-containing protein